MSLLASQLSEAAEVVSATAQEQPVAQEAPVLAGARSSAVLPAPYLVTTQLLAQLAGPLSPAQRSRQRLGRRQQLRRGRAQARAEAQ